MSGSFTDQYRVVQEHCGQPKLPSQATQAIRTITRRSHDARVWTWAARCLSRARPPWAYRCYRRAVRLDPDDLALAEEAGMFGLTAIGAGQNLVRHAHGSHQVDVEPLTPAVSGSTLAYPAWA